jgi:hypothetical protein
MPISRPIRSLLVIFVLALLVFVSNHQPESQVVYSQDGGDDVACSTLIDDALSTIGSACAEVGNNEACYGNILVAATLNEDSEASFESSGDIVNLNDLRALFTQPANPNDGTWGLALLTVQADLPTYSGAALTYVLFGDAHIQDSSSTWISNEVSNEPTCEVSNSGTGNINVRGGPSTNDTIVNVFNAGETAVADGRNEAGDWVYVDYGGSDGWLYTPLIEIACDVQTLPIVHPDISSDSQSSYAYMQSITLESGNSEACERSPDGLLVRSPEGLRARIVVNGVELTMSSAGFITAQADGDLVIQGLEGSIDVTSAGQTETVTDGIFTTVPLDGLQADGPPTPPQPINPNTDLPALDTANTALVSSNVGLPSCALTNNNVSIVYSGPSDLFISSFEIPPNSPIAVTDTYTDSETTYYRILGDGWVSGSNVTLVGNCTRLPTTTINSSSYTLPPNGNWALIATIIKGGCEPDANSPGDVYQFPLTLTFSDDRSTMDYNDGLPFGTTTYSRIDDMTYFVPGVYRSRFVFTSSTTFIEDYATGPDECSFEASYVGYFLGP